MSCPYCQVVKNGIEKRVRKMLIKVKLWMGTEIEIQIEPTEKSKRIKERVAEKTGWAASQHKLIFSGQHMEDEKTAADYKIQDGSVLLFMFSLRF